MNLNYGESLPLITMYARCGYVSYQCEGQAKNDPVLGAIVFVCKMDAMSVMSDWNVLCTTS